MKKVGIKMEIKLEIGIDSIKVGMKKSEVEQILGQPDRIRIDEDDDNKLMLDFNALNLRLSFYPKEENKLAYIECSNKNLTFNGKKIIDSNIDFVKKVTFGDSISEWEVSEYRSFTAHFNEKYWVTLQSDYEKVTEIELGVPFEDEETYKWPK